MSDLPTDEARRALADEFERHILELMCGGGDMTWPEIAQFAQFAMDNREPILASLRGKTDGGAGEMQTELRPFKDGEGEGLDEVVICGSHIVHAETMSDTALWIGIHDQAGGLVHIWVNAVRRKGRLGIVMAATDEGDRDTIGRALPLDSSPQGEGGGA